MDGGLGHRSRRPAAELLSRQTAGWKVEGRMTSDGAGARFPPPRLMGKSNVSRLVSPKSTHSCRFVL